MPLTNRSANCRQAQTGRSSQKSRTSEVEYVAAAAACDQ
jgi:hypothetical protein